MNKITNFTEGKILRPLINFAFPILLSLLLQAMYGSADLLIVGWFGSEADMSAVATGSHMMNSFIGAIGGLASGLTILIGQKIGEGREDELSDVCQIDSVWFPHDCFQSYRRPAGIKTQCVKVKVLKNVGK